jgi:hypothetical protein
VKDALDAHMEQMDLELEEGSVQLLPPQNVLKKPDTRPSIQVRGKTKIKEPVATQQSTTKETP